MLMAMLLDVGLAEKDEDADDDADDHGDVDDDDVYEHPGGCSARHNCCHFGLDDMAALLVVPVLFIYTVIQLWLASIPITHRLYPLMAL